jgi:hypothetical protein
MPGRYWVGRYCAQGADLAVAQRVVKRVTFATATTGAIAAKELFTVTGMVLATVIPICVGTDLTGAGATIEYGSESDTDLFLGAITATTWDDAEIGINTTPLPYLVMSDTQPNWAYLSEEDIGYEVKVATIDTGVVDWYCYWYPLSDDANVESAGVNVTL